MSLQQLPPEVRRLVELIGADLATSRNQQEVSRIWVHLGCGLASGIFTAVYCWIGAKRVTIEIDFPEFPYQHSIHWRVP